MATRGIKQLQKLTLSYCEHGGSSRYLREYIRSGQIIDYARSNPTVHVSVEVRNGRHPNITASYVTGWDKQVCVKNEEVKRISKVITMLNDSSGRKIKKFEGPIQTQTPTVQGIWTPFLDLSDAKFGMEIVKS